MYVDTFVLSYVNSLKNKKITSSVADPDPFDTDPDPDPACHFDTDTDHAFQSDTDPDPTVWSRSLTFQRDNVLKTVIFIGTSQLDFPCQ